jgi:hypothetical protein
VELFCFALSCCPLGSRYCPEPLEGLRSSLSLLFHSLRYREKSETQSALKLHYSAKEKIE